MASSSTPTSLQLTIFTTISLLSITFLRPSSTAATNRPPPPRQPFKKIYAFGDSFTDTGNTRSVSGPSGFGHVSNPPYGITYFKHSTNRYSDGRLVIDFVAEALSLPFLPAYLNIKGNNSLAKNGVNFAVAGSTAIKHAFFVKNNMSLDVTPQSIGTQLSWFEEFMRSNGCSDGDKCREEIGDALFWVGEIGVNDYAYTLGSTVSIDVIRRLGVSSLTHFLEALLKKGAKYVVVQGLPLSGCLPLSMYLAPENDRDKLGCVGTLNNHSYTHILSFQSNLDDLRKRYPQSVIVYADYWNAHRAVMMNPESFGFKEKFRVCCGTGEPYNFDVISVCGTRYATLCKNPSQYINWDGVHLTEAMYKVIADMYLNGNFTHPPFDYLLNKKQRQGGK